jgi:hypothetical protein
MLKSGSKNPRHRAAFTQVHIANNTQNSQSRAKPPRNSFTSQALNQKSKRRKIEAVKL